MQRRLILVCVLLLSASAWLAHAATPEPPRAHQPLAQVPMVVGEWRGTRAPDLEPAVIDALGVDEYINRTYTAGPKTAAGLYVGFYESQRRGRTMHSPLNCLPSAGWQPVSHDYEAIDVAAPEKRTIDVNRYVITKGLDKLLVLYWYQAHDRVIASEYTAKFYLVADALRLNRTDGSLVRVVTPFTDDTDLERAGRSARAFVTEIFPILRQYLPA
jgi:EpsI family protein